MFYSPNAIIRRRQMIGDAIVAAWTALWIWIGLALHSLINKLAVPGQYLADGGNRLSSSDNGNSLIRTALKPINSVGDSLSGAGAAQINAVHDISLGIALLVILGPTLPVLLSHILRRYAWLRVARLIRNVHNDNGAGQRLLAQRALAHQPIKRLLAISADPVADIEAGNYRPYAELETR